MVILTTILPGESRTGTHNCAAGNTPVGRGPQQLGQYGICWIELNLYGLLCCLLTQTSLIHGDKPLACCTEE